MGPTILLDKSSLQRLSKKELSFLYKHYFVVILPVLLIECLADLKKFSDSEESRKEVQILANKFRSLDSMINIYFRWLCASSLLGEEVSMEGKAVIPEGKVLKASDGTPFVFLDTQPEREAIWNWQNGRFSENEKILAEKWRFSMNNFNLERFRQQFKGLLNKHKIRDIISLRSRAETLIDNPKLQKECLDVLISELGLTEPIKTLVYNRWLKENMPPLRNFAPYAHFCLQVMMVFTLGIATGLLSTKSTNIIDMEYFFYTPFANIFCSTDRIFQQRLAPVILQSDQTLFDGEELKLDLKTIADHWDGLANRKSESMLVTSAYIPLKIQVQSPIKLGKSIASRGYPEREIKLKR